MASKKSRTAFIITLCVCILLASLSTGFSKTSKHHSSHRKHSAVHRKHSTAKLKLIDNNGNLVLRSSAAFVEDQQTGKVLIQKQAKAIMPIASITKLMTAMVVLDASLDLDESLTIEEEDAESGGRSRLAAGTELTRREALLLALMSSDNRCANALGRTYPGGMKACVAAMNAKARSLGLSNTHFQGTIGLSSGNVSSARDLARLVDTAYQYDLICEFTTCKKATIYVGWHALEFQNTNQLVRNSDWQIGLSKTGFTGEAGKCLVMQAKVAQRPLLIVLLDSRGSQTRIADAKRIKRWLESKSRSQQT